MTEKNDYLIQREDNMFKADALIRCSDEHAYNIARQMSVEYNTRCDVFRIVIAEHICMVRPEAKR